MDTLLVAVVLIGILLLLISAFFMIEKQKRKRKDREIMDHFSRRGTHHGLSFTSQEMINDSIIGIDGIQRLMLVVHKTPAGSSEQLIDISKMKSCSSKRIDRTLSGAGGTRDSYAEKLVLQIAMANEGDNCEIAFYSHIHNDIYDLQEAEKRASHWERILKKMAAV